MPTTPEHTDPHGECAAEIARRLKAATPGPWIRAGCRHKLGSEDCIWVGPDNFMIVAIPVGRTDKQHGGAALRDGEFIAHAPTDIAYLLEALRQARNDALEEAATVADGFYHEDACNGEWEDGRNIAAAEIAADIRALFHPALEGKT